MGRAIVMYDFVRFLALAGFFLFPILTVSGQDQVSEKLDQSSSNVTSQEKNDQMIRASREKRGAGFIFSGNIAAYTDGKSGRARGGILEKLTTIMRGRPAARKHHHLRRRFRKNGRPSISTLCARRRSRRGLPGTADRDSYESILQSYRRQCDATSLTLIGPRRKRGGGIPDPFEFWAIDFSKEQRLKEFIQQTMFGRFVVKLMKGGNVYTWQVYWPWSSDVREEVVCGFIDGVSSEITEAFPDIHNDLSIFPQGLHREIVGCEIRAKLIDADRDYSSPAHGRPEVTLSFEDSAMSDLCPPRKRVCNWQFPNLSLKWA